MIGNRVWCIDTSRYATITSRPNGVTIVEYSSGDTAKGHIVNSGKTFKRLHDQNK